MIGPARKEAATDYTLELVPVSRIIEPLPLGEAFGREYEIEWLRDMPSSLRVSRYGSGPGPILRVMPHGGEEFVITVPGEAGTVTLSTLPNPRQFAVFNRRDMPVIVDVDNPETLKEVEQFRSHGLRNILPIPTAGVIVLSSCCSIVAYDGDGLRWEHNADLFCCDEPMIDVVFEQIIVDGHAHENGGRRRSVVDARTGTVITPL